MPPKPVLDDIKRAQICAILAVGGSRALAANYVGCAPETIRRTADRDPEFHAALLRAESQHEIQCLQRIQDASKKDTHWRAATWTLERIYPDRYATRKPHSLNSVELAEFLDRFAEIVTTHVTDPETCEMLLSAMSALSTELKSESQRATKRRRRAVSPRRKKSQE